MKDIKYDLQYSIDLVHNFVVNMRTYGYGIQLLLDRFPE